LSGPSFAKEVASGLPTDVVAASTDGAAAAFVQQELHTPMFRVYTSDDPIGVQVGGAVKNVIAIAAGACDGLGLGTNARAALIARGLAEITRLGVALGADPLTFLGMAGVGDLILTCTGALSRNRELGMKVAEGLDPKAYLASKRSVAEGFWTSAATYALAKKRGVDMPITDQVYHVLHEGRPLLDALKMLVTRSYKGELLGIRAERMADFLRDPTEIAQRYLDAIERGDRAALEAILAPDVVVESPIAGVRWEIVNAVPEGDSVALELACDGQRRAIFVQTRGGQITRIRSYVQG
jgi:hypothetical protein